MPEQMSAEEWSSHIDPRYKGSLVWGIDPPGNDGMSYGLYTSKGEKINDKAPASANFAIWWDGDLVRELLDHEWNGTFGKPKIEKWDAENRCLKTIFQPEGVLSNNGTKGNPVLQANLFGDWREEVIWRTEDSKGAPYLYNDTSHPSPYLHADARSGLQARDRLAEHRVQPAAAHKLLSRNRDEKTAEARSVHSGKQSGDAALGGMYGIRSKG